MTDASDINSVAGVFKLYLRELREPLFPIIYFEQIMELARKKFPDKCLSWTFIINLLQNWKTKGSSSPRCGK